MKKINKILGFAKYRITLAVVSILAGMVALSSCNFLDIDDYINEKVTLDSVFTTKEKTLQYINGTTVYLPDESILFSGGTQTIDGVAVARTVSPFITAADEAIMPWIDGNHRGMYLLTDQVTPQDIRGFAARWTFSYKGIRKTNIIISRIGENKELTDMERRDYLGRAHFMRAYYYYTLLRTWGPVPILPEEALDTDTTTDEASFERNTWDECLEYICKDFERAAELLPLTRETIFQYIPTKGAALSFIARLRLYSASPLYNGNTYYSGWKRTNGDNFISQVEDKDRWGKAAAAFKRVIDLNRYSIFTVEAIETSEEGGLAGTLSLPEGVTSDPNYYSAWPNGAGGIDPYRSYKDMFDGSVQPDKITEFIYYYPRANNDDWIYFPNRMSGINGFSVDQDVIDDYRMDDGRQYSEATDDEKSWEAVGQRDAFSENYTLTAERAKMHDKREPRFYATIGFQYRFWPGTSYTGTETVKNLTIDYSKNSPNAQPSGSVTVDYNRTGYTAVKYIHAEDNMHWSTSGQRKAKTFPVMRYAEILLGYVEAMNEMTGSYTDEATGITVSKNTAEMVSCFNQIRHRAGLPGISEAEASDYGTMKQLLIQERRIEFAFEGHRGFDLRRWKTAPEEINRPLLGMDVSAMTAERQKFYTTRIWNTEISMRRVFNNKMYFYPIDQATLDRNGRLVQTPGW